MQNLPISIVIPVRNEATTLSELFAALDALSPKPAEVVFVDTGSDDGSLVLIENWMAHVGNAQIKGQLCRQHGAYPGAARNIGIKAASQPWVAFLDAGIVPHADWLGKLWACQKRSSATAVYGACRFHSADSWGRMICAVSYGQEQIAPVLPASLFQKEVFERAGYFEENLRSGEDVRWKRNLACVGISVQDCNEALVEYGHFPSGLGGSLKKWFVYEQSATVAGVGGGRRAFMLFAIGMLYFLMAIGVAGHR
ncbi:glycosyltransferase family 2 protein [Dechloromonas sp. A34]|uniref:glycosyltransferase family 2 protein n=1 Tax=Dechloromonas sp. A34 TaxID=447588 RepID=UPI002248E15F|nr:glycosyltransferase family A protein [Dechloromonas sp. A34]